MIELIHRSTAEILNIPEKDIMLDTNEHKYSHPRFYIWYIAFKYANIKYKDLEAYFNKGNNSIRHGVRQIEIWTKTDKQLRELIDRITNRWQYYINNDYNKATPFLIDDTVKNLQLIQKYRKIDVEFFEQTLKLLKSMQ